MNSVTETTLRFSGDYPTLAVVALAVVLAAAMWWLYRREAQLQSGPASWLPAALRTVAVFVLVLALAAPVLRHESTVRQLGRVVVAVDASASMQLEDEGGPATPESRASDSRFTRAQRLLLDGPVPLLKKLAETQDVELVMLRGQQSQRLWWHRQRGRDISGPLPQVFDLPADATVTNLDSTLRDAMGPDVPGTALVILTDGQHNAPGSPEEMAATLKQSRTPVFTIGFGSEVPPPDLSILNVTTAESVFAEENLQGRAFVSDSLPSGIPAQIRVISGEKTLWEQNFTSDGKGERRFDFTFPVKDLPAPPQAEKDRTLRQLQVQVAVMGDKAGVEKTRVNNSRDVAIHLLDKKRKVLLLDGRPRWETRYIHNHFDRDDRWEVRLLLDDYAARPESGALQKGFPKSREELLTYDLILLGDVSPDRFSITQTDWLLEFVEKRGGGLVLVDGVRSHLKQWAMGKMASLCPVSWTGNAFAPNQRIIWHLSDRGTSETALRLSDSPSANSSLWPSLPAMNWAANVQARPGATILAYFASSQNAPAQTGSESRPAAVFQPVGAGAVLYLGTDDLWRWRYQVGDLYHQRLWMQLAAWIAAPPFQAEDSRVSIGTDRLRYSPGETSEIRVRLRDAEGNLVSQAEPRAILMLDGKEVATLTLEPDPTHFGIFRARTPPLKAGSYEVAVAESATTQRSNLRLSLHVADAGNPEWATLTLNRPLLEAMATASGGRFLREEQAATELPNLLQALDRRQTTISETLLWSSWWWFGTVVILLCAEWVFRRKFRLV